MKRPKILGGGRGAERGGAQTASGQGPVMDRRTLLRRTGVVAGGLGAAGILAACGDSDSGQGLRTDASPSASPGASPSASVSGESRTSWEQGKMQTYPRIKDGRGGYLTQQIDIAYIGPDVDQIVSIDWTGAVPSGAQIVSGPRDGSQSETRAVFLVRTSISKVQLEGIGGDSIMLRQVSDADLDRQARDHAGRNGALHPHITTYYLGDLREFEKAYAQQEATLLRKLIRAQEPPVPEIGIPTTG